MAEAMRTASAAKSPHAMLSRAMAGIRGKTLIINLPGSPRAAVENFQVVLLNTRRKLIEVVKVSDGTLDTILVHPREVFKPAIAANAAAIILLHNHPSGEATPSEADIKVTRDLIRAGQLLKIEVLDHVILGKRTEERPVDFVSLRSLGYFSSVG